MAFRFVECINTLIDDEKKRLCNHFEKYIVKNGDGRLLHGRLDACGYGEIRLIFRGSAYIHWAAFSMSQPDVYLMSQMMFLILCSKENVLSYIMH